MSTYSSPFLVNPLCLDPGTEEWFYAREDFARTGAREAYDRMLSFVSTDVPLMAWE